MLSPENIFGVLKFQFNTYYLFIQLQWKNQGPKKCQKCAVKLNSVFPSFLSVFYRQNSTFLDEVYLPYAANTAPCFTYISKA